MAPIMPIFSQDDFETLWGPLQFFPQRLSFHFRKISIYQISHLQKFQCGEALMPDFQPSPVLGHTWLHLPWVTASKEKVRWAESQKRKLAYAMVGSKWIKKQHQWHFENNYFKKTFCVDLFPNEWIPTVLFCLAWKFPNSNDNIFPHIYNLNDTFTCAHTYNIHTYICIHTHRQLKI